MAIITLTSENFKQEVLDSEKPVLVDFWASWCGPCRMIAPIIDQIAEEHEEFKVAKVDIDAQPEIASQFNVVSIPTLIVFRDGQPAEKAVGARPKAQILALME